MEQHVANKSMLRKGCGNFFWLKDSVIFQHCLPQQQSSNLLDVEKLLSPASIVSKPLITWDGGFVMSDIESIFPSSSSCPSSSSYSSRLVNGNFLHFVLLLPCDIVKSLNLPNSQYIALYCVFSSSFENHKLDFPAFRFPLKK